MTAEQVEGKGVYGVFALRLRPVVDALTQAGRNLRAVVDSSVPAGAKERGKQQFLEEAGRLKQSGPVSREDRQNS